MMSRPQEVPATQSASTSLRSSPLQGQRVLLTTLALVAPLSSSSSRAEHEWLRMFPQSSTVSSSAPDVRSTKSFQTRRVLPNTAEQLTLLQAFFALSKTQLAQICRVQRQTIYDWFAGNFEAEDNNARRVAQLFGIARDVKAAGAQPLSARDLTRGLTDGSTILSLLAADDASSDRVGSVVAQLEEARSVTRANTANTARERLGWKPISDESAERNLDINLDEFSDG